MNNWLYRLIRPPKYWRIKHDYELGELWRQAPEVFRFYNLAGVKELTFAPFTEQWQHFAFDLLRDAAWPWFTLDELKERFTSLYGYRTALTNNNGFGNPNDLRANFITGENLDHPLPKIANLCFGGNVLHPVAKDGTFITVETLDANKPPPAVTRASHPHLIHFATIAQLDGDVIRFPHLSDASRGIYLDVPVPLVSKVQVKYPKNDTVFVGTTVPSPYYTKA